MAMELFHRLKYLYVTIFVLEILYYEQMIKFFFENIE